MSRRAPPPARAVTAPALAGALDALAGAVVVLDAELRVVAASAGAARLLGGELPVGARAVQVMCGSGAARPIADALAAGRAVVGTVVRPRPGGGSVALRVDATPIEAPGGGDDGEGVRDGRGARAAGRPQGWLLRLGEDAPELAEPERPIEVHGIVTADIAMKRLLHIARRAATTDVTVLVRGETGAGKELLARAIHAMSPRAAGPFRAINCAALSPALLESELFGHVRGAFTGAVRDAPGHFRSAHGGTLMLDEIAEMPLELQAKLLRVLETGAVIPVGAIDPIAVDVRVVAATHRSLRAQVAAGQFRDDLMYRLRKVPLFLPPLRDRPGDIALLAHRLLARLNARGGRRVERIAADARSALERYAWPGNVRELANALEYAYVVGDGPTLIASDLPPEIAEPGRAPDALLHAPVNAPGVADEAAAGQPGPAGSGAREARPEATRILRALERAGGHRGRAARLLGISRVTLWRRMNELGLQPR